MLEHVLGPPQTPQLLFASAYRNNEVKHSEFLQLVLERRRVADNPQTQRIELEPLAVKTTLDLGHELLREQDLADAIALAKHLSAETTYIPFLMLELAQYIKKQQAE